MQTTRRHLVGLGAAGLGLAAGGGLLAPPACAANAPGWDPALFAAHSLAEVARRLGATPVASAEVTIFGPDLSEDGTVVPIGVHCSVPGTTAIGVVVPNNPHALACWFRLSHGAEPAVATRLKLARSSRIYAIALLGTKLLYADTEVKVTGGGCGG
jgi:sulfur-oxidizing protein SoxY